MTLDPDDPLTGITGQINGAAIAVHRELGPGLLETAYQACLEYELLQRHMNFQRQVKVSIIYIKAFTSTAATNLTCWLKSA